MTLHWPENENGKGKMANTSADALRTCGRNNQLGIAQLQGLMYLTKSSGVRISHVLGYYSPRICWVYSLLNGAVSWVGLVVIVDLFPV